MMVKVSFEIPTVEKYKFLRDKCGLSFRGDEAVKAGLPRSLFSVCAYDNADIIGMGRVVGDGGCYCQVTDVCVLPDYQAKGIGKMLMNEISVYLDNLPPTCYVSLLNDNNIQDLFEQFGFEKSTARSKRMQRK